MTATLNYHYVADALAAKAGVPAPLVSALVNAESAWNPNAVSKSGATGLGQFTTGTGRDYGLVGLAEPPEFDHRKDAALNLTAVVMYLADLKGRNPTWREVIGHYSGQGPSLAGYAAYSAGQALIATIAMVDGVPIPPPDGELTVTVGVTQGGSTVPFVIKTAAAALTAMIVAGGMMACSQVHRGPPQQIAASTASTELPVRDFWTEHPPTFRLVPGPLGFLAAPRQ